MRDDDSDPLPTPLVPLPRRLPATAMGRLIADSLGLVADVAEAPGMEPPGAVLSYHSRGDDRRPVASQPWHADRDDAPRALLARLEEGIHLALPVHGGWRADGVPLIDGRASGAGELVPEERIVEGEPADGLGPGRLSPAREYFALGLARDGDGLSVEQILVEIFRDGRVSVRLRAFPEGLRRRVAAYLLRLE